MSGWRYYFPDEAETADDAREFVGVRRRIDDADDAAQAACEKDYHEHDGWERGESEFEIAVISPAGDEFRFRAWHEPSVEHHVSKTR